MIHLQAGRIHDQAINAAVLKETRQLGPVVARLVHQP